MSICSRPHAAARRFLIALAGLAALFSGVTHAQLTGTRNVPGDYADLAAALTDLNTVGVGAGGVVINVVAGNAQAAPAGGYVVNLAAANATAANPITIRGNGNTVTASAGHTVGAINDAIFKVIGEDFVTIESFVMNENAANAVAAAGTNTMTEWGVAVLYRTVTDGAKNVTIRDNTIVLGSNPPTLGYSNTFGIYASSRHSPTAPSTAAENTTAAGAHDNLRIYGNQISRVNMGIAAIGSLTGAGMATGLDIGGASAATGNSITDFGLAGPASTYQSVSGSVNGVLLNNQLNFRVAHNTITSNNGQVTAATLRGVYVQSTGALPTFIASTRTISNNTISLRGGGASGIAGIVDEGGNVATTLIINDNNFVNSGHTVASAGAITFIGKTVGGPQTTTINGNTFTNLSVNTTGSVTLIDNSVTRPAGGTITVNNNAIVGAFAKTGAGGTFRCYNNFATSPATVTEVNTGNTCTNITLTGATAADLWRSADGATPGSRKTITNNTIGNVVGGASAINGLWVGFSDLNFNGTVVSGNVISNITSAGPIAGILTDGQNQNFIGNTVHTLSSSGATAVVTGILASGGTNQVIARNRIYNLENTGAGGAVTGIGVTSTTGPASFAIHSNLIGDLRAPNSTAANSLHGINFAPTLATVTGDIAYNTVLLAATTSTAGPFGANALFASTTPTTIVRNNVLVNRSTPAGAGLVVAHRRTTSGLTTYGAASGNNLYWAGTPGPANLIYTDGTASDQLIADFRTRVADRDRLSVSADPVFLSAAGANANFLRPDPAIATPIESGAVPIAGLTTDFAGQPRNAVTPDIGAWEFAGIPLDTVVPDIRYTALAQTASTADRALAVVITDAGGVASGGSAPRIYYRKGASGAFVSAACAGASPNYTCTIAYAAIGGVAAGDTVQYFVIAQDLGGNVGAVPGAGLVATDVNTVTTPPTTPNAYAIVAPIAAAVTVGSGAGDTYASLTNAGGLFAAINAGVLTQNVTATITTDLTAETGAVLLNQAIEEGAGAGTYQLRIQPSGARVVSGTVGGVATSLIDVNGADRLTIDGLNAAGATLTIRNTTVGGTTSTIRFANDAVGNTLTNLIIESGTGGTMVNLAAGVVTGNDQFVLSNSLLRGTAPTTVPFNGFGSTAVFGNVLNSDVSVTGNTFTDFQQAGVFINFGTENVRVNGNTMQQTADRASAQFGIAVNGASGTQNEFNGNTVTALRATAANSATGINVNGVTQGTIAGNRVFGFAPPSGATGQQSGITWGGSALVPTSIRVVNNYISIAPAATNAQTIIGLFDAGFPGNEFVADHNTVFVGGTASGTVPSFAMIRVSRSTSHTTRNNIFFNNRTGGTGAHVARSDQAAGTGTFVSDRNYYAGLGSPTAANFFENGVGNFVSFAGWQAGPPARDANAIAALASSVTLAQFFVDAAAGNLNLLATAGVAPAGPVNGGSPLPSVTTDIVGTARSTVAPELGAFEIVPSSAPTITPASGITRQRGTAASSSTIATVADPDTPVGSLVVTAPSIPTGLTVSGIANSSGTITANLAASCSATLGANTVDLQVTDGQTPVSGNLSVEVTANTPPVLTYAAQIVGAGSGATINPATGPADNGSVASIVLQSAGTYTGGVSVNNSTGVVTLTAAAPPGNHTLTIRATDNCGDFTDATIALNVTITNTPPTITASPVTRVAGSPVATLQIATVADAQDPPASLGVTVNGGASATASGVTVSSLAIDSGGVVNASVLASCTATNASFTLRATDTGALFSETLLNVTVSANTPPVLTYPGGTTLVFGQNASVTPASGPSDNGSVTTVVVQSPGTFTGGASVDSAGVVSLTAAAPVAVTPHTITIRATDNCNANTDVGVPVTVNRANSTTTITASTPDPSIVGTPVLVQFTVVALAPGAGTPAGNVTVSDSVDSCTASVATGQCTLTLTTPGARTLTATFTDTSGNFNGSSGTDPHVVNPVNIFRDGFEAPGTLNLNADSDASAPDASGVLPLSRDLLDGLAVDAEPVDALELEVGADLLVVQARRIDGGLQVRVLLRDRQGIWSAGSWQSAVSGSIAVRWLREQGNDGAPTISSWLDVN